MILDFISKEKYNFWCSITLIVTFICSYFEFFFRSDSIMFPIYIVSLLFLLVYNSSIKGHPMFTVFLIGLFVVNCVQATLQTDINYYFPFSRLLFMLSMFILANLNSRYLLELFVDIMAVISSYSLIIYFLNFIPTVNEYLVYHIAPKCVSIGAEKALQEGGGINIIIYNFQHNYMFQAFNMFRNCGPFWEPGMFAVFLNLALYINHFILKKGTLLTIIFVVSIISTVSTGGISAGLFIVFVNTVIKKSNPILTLFSFLLFIGLVYIFANTDFLGDKLNNQLVHANTGSDESRFGAMLTQVKMIFDNPLFGYVGFKGYAIETEYLCSGTLLPFVQMGVPIGTLYYYMMYRSTINYALYYNQKSIIGKFLFLLIMILSISQTILLSTFFCIFTIAGLRLKSYKQ